MSIEVKVVNMEPTTIEVERKFTGSKLVDQWNSQQEVEAHKVKLKVTSDDGTSFIFTHNVYPIKNWDASVVAAQAALMNFAAALQKRLNTPIQ